MSTIDPHRQHAIVIGGSLGGLLTARVLSDHYDRVTIIEKDKVARQPESRPGQPHTRHLHALLATGLNIIKDYFPDLEQALIDHGAVLLDAPAHSQWYTYGGYRQRFTSGLRGVFVSRILLEHLVRERVLSVPKIELLDRATVTQLRTTPAGDPLSQRQSQRVIGVTIEQHDREPQTTSLSADLVVDVTGRNSHTPQWLRDLGYEPPQVSEVKVNVGYATRIYRRDPHDPRSQTWFFNTPEAPQEKRFGGMFPVEGDRWVVAVGSWHSDFVHTQANDFLEFVRSLPSSDIYDIISQCEPLSDVMPYKFPSSLRRHYERLSQFPAGYLVLGDAISSFNPTYGQGMTVAAMEAAALDRLLIENPALFGAAAPGENRLARTFFDRAARIIETPWQLAVGEDFRFPQTTGPKPPGVDLINWYVARMHRATLRDPVVCETFFQVMNLLVPPTNLFHPGIIWRVLVA